MGKFRVLVECRNEGGTDLHCWDNVQAANEKDAEHKAVEMARRYYRNLMSSSLCGSNHPSGGDGRWKLSSFHSSPCQRSPPWLSAVWMAAAALLSLRKAGCSDL